MVIVIFITILRPEERVYRHLVLLLMLAVAAAPAEAGFYRWTDAEGREFYTNELEKVPPQYRSGAKPVEVREDRVSTEPARELPAAGRSTPAQPHKDLNGRGERYWKKRADDLRRKIRKREAERSALVKQQEAADQRHTVPNKAEQKAKRDRQRKVAKIDQDLKRLHHELDMELPDEARKAGALPGWVR
jgi:hypothetical protein